MPLFATLAVIAALQDTTARPVPADAFADTGVARLVELARSRRSRQERLVSAYTAMVTQRLGVGVRALRRDRMLFSQEMTARIHWRRDSTTRIEMIGARQTIPIAIAGRHVPQDLDNQGAWLAFDPSEDYLRLLGNDPEGFLYPLAPGAEQEYRYAAGDTTRITLPSGRAIALIELLVTPRRSSFRLLAGSLWLDADTYGVVRMVVRPSRPFDLELDGDSGEADDVPGMLKPIRVEVRFITVEYGLYDSRWWLPRIVALDGEAQIGSFLRSPARFERVYTVSNVVGGTEPPVATALRWRAGGRRPDLKTIDTSTIDRDSLAASIATCIATALAADTTNVPGADTTTNFRVRRAQRRARRRCSTSPRPDVAVEVPADTMALLTSPELGPSILDIGDVINEGDLRDFSDAIGGLPQAPWQLLRPTVSISHFRYNRVEALSAGVRARMDFGRLNADATVRLGVGDWVPNAEINVRRLGRTVELGVSGYRALVSVDPPTRALGSGNSIAAFLFGVDDGDYYRTTGIAFTGQPGGSHSRWVEWRVFVESQRAAAKETDFSVPHLFDGARAFRPNITAAAANQGGARVTLRGFHTYATALGLGADLTVEGQTGDFDLARAALTTRATAPVGRGLVLGVEGAVGSSVGDVPPQTLWYLGGATTLRGYAGGIMAGQAFWRSRAEIGLGLPAFRIAAFSDAGWAGARGALGGGRPLISAGMGFSLLDGLLRFDVSKGLRAPRGWRVDLYADGVL